MLVLCINTGTIESNLCIVQDGQILARASWSEMHREAEILMPSLKRMLQNAKVQMSDLEGVFVVCGPGSFSAIRIGVVTANTLALNLDIKLFSINTFELMSYMYEGYDYIALNGGGTTLLVQDGKDISSIKVEDFNRNEGVVATDLTEKQLDILDHKFVLLEKSLNFDQVCVRMSSEDGFAKFRVNDLPLLPHYIKKPSIS
jgi:tRNA threonylcarbamoyl adenosine modification protein YeaZ